MKFVEDAVRRFFSGLLFLIAGVSTSTAQDVECWTTFRARTGGGLFPGSIAADAGNSCVVLAATTFGALGEMRVMRQPKNGTFTILNRSSFRYQPKPGFTGKDFGVVKFGSRRASPRVRFAITVQ